MYTKGIRKILCPTTRYYENIENLQDMAEDCGYDAISHNGQIFIKAGVAWVETVFSLDDFSG